MHEKLFTPGPTEVRMELLQELATPQIHHRTEEFSVLYDDIQQGLQQLLFTEKPVFLFTSSSTGAMEAAVTNGVEKKCLNLINGAFSKRWHQITEKNGIPCEAVNVDWDKPITPELVDKKLKTGEYDAVTIVLNETSTGMLNPVAEIAQVVKKYDDILLFVDAVSGMAGTKIPVDEWDLDMCLAGVQKAFALPAGLTVAAVSDKLLERSETVPERSYYFNLPLMNKYHKRSQTRTTPCIPQLNALRKQLQYITEEEGIEQRFKRHQQMAEIVQNWAQKYFDIYPQTGYWSPTVTCVKNTRDISVTELNETLIEEHNMRIANGYGDMKNKAFRIAHMGDMSVAEIKGLLLTINDIL
ncbi:MAG: pyridoxal-phosphate-dependent aminotransferase family protein, partial [Halanaerobiaceae bacterium]